MIKSIIFEKIGKKIQEEEQILEQETLQKTIDHQEMLNNNSQSDDDDIDSYM